MTDIPFRDVRRTDLQLDSAVLNRVGALDRRAREDSARLMALGEALEEHRAHERESERRIEELEQEARHGRPEHREHLDRALRAERERLDQIRAQRREAEAQAAAARARYNASKATRTAVAQYLESLPRGARLVARSGPPAEPRKGESLADAIERTRREIAERHEARGTVERAPLPVADQRAGIERLVRDSAAAGAVTLRGVEQGRPIPAFAGDYHRGDAGRRSRLGMRDVFDLQCALTPDLVTAALEREIDPAADESALTAQERVAKLAELDAEILALERQEESLVSQALDRGLDVRRRPGASPVAILGIADPADVAEEVAA